MVSLDCNFNLAKHVLAATADAKTVMTLPVLMVMSSINCLAGESWQQETCIRTSVLTRLRLGLRCLEMHLGFVCSLICLLVLRPAWKGFIPKTINPTSCILLHANPLVILFCNSYLSTGTGTTANLQQICAVPGSIAKCEPNARGRFLRECLSCRKCLSD
jgi:hypothetical protein